MMKYYKEKLLYVIDRVSKLIGHRQCYICHQSNQQLVCTDCLQDTILPLFPAPAHNQLEHKLVHDNLITPAYEGLYALGRYEGIIKILINQLKFSNKSLAANVLAIFFEKYICGVLAAKHRLPEVIVPIPLSAKRHFQREYNQARLISQSLASSLDIEILDALQKVRHTPQQSSLKREGRLQNVKAAFLLHKPIHAKHIAIVDDVVTTGATTNEACHAILHAYPDMQIDVWCMAISLK